MSVFVSKLNATALAAGAMALALAGAPQAAHAQSPCGNAITVSSGDTLYSIARDCGTTVSALANHNNIANPNRIEVGQRIAMPGRVAGGAPEQAMGLTPQERYEVRLGRQVSAVFSQSTCVCGE